jgi:thioredoxin 1
MSQLTVVNESNFASEVEGSDLPVVVDFYADWCGPCKMITPVLQELAAQHDGKLKVVKCDIDANPALAIRFGVMSIPNLLFFKQGEVVNQMVGFGGKDALTGKVNEFIGS